MILTVDIGNSRIKWASWLAETIVARGVLAYDAKKMAGVFDQLFYTVEKPDNVFALCVAGDEMQRALSEWVKQNWQLNVVFLTTGKTYKDIKNAYADPGRHGVDRWAAMVAAHQSEPALSLCVISAGTAITFDLIEKNGQHLGGYILPSYMTMHKALLCETSNLELTPDTDMQQQGIPDNTDDAVNQGLHKLLQAGIREICQHAVAHLDAPVRIILTGGFAKTILSYPDMPAMQHKPDLVMQGLYNIIKRR